MSLTISVSEIVEKSNNPLLSKHASWGRVLLGEIAIIQNGFAFSSHQFSKDGDMPLIRIRDVGRTDTDTRYSGDYDKTYVVNQGDLLVGMDGDFNCARWRGPRGLLNQRVCRIKLTSDIYHPKLLDYVLPGYLKAINDNTSSVTVKHLSSKSIGEIPLPLPPMQQQELIVTELEKQSSRLDEAVEGLKRIKANLKRYKATVLKAAVEGKLTEEWRKAHPNVESGAALLKRILAERKKNWEEKYPGKKYKEPAAPDTTSLPELPKGWVWATVGQCFKVGVGATPSRKEPRYWNGDIPWVSSGEVQFSRVRNTREFITKEGLANSSTQINPAGSVLLGMIGEGKTRGQAAILEIEAANNQNCAAIWVSETKFKPEYVFYWLMQRYEETRMIGSGNNQQALNKAIIETMPFPLPPISEHIVIVDTIASRISVVEEFDAQVDTNFKRAERLRQGILKNAFSGGLSTYLQPTRGGESTPK